MTECTIKNTNSNCVCEEQFWAKGFVLCRCNLPFQGFYNHYPDLVLKHVFHSKKKSYTYL